MNSSWDIVSLPALCTHVWDTLAHAISGGPHPWRTPVLATAGPAGPNARTVVLRGLTRPGFELLAFSDSRTAKVAELANCPAATWLCYDPGERVQLRLFSTARLHLADSVAQTYWHRLPDESRVRYQAGAIPGSVIAHPADAAAFEFGNEGDFTVIVAAVRRFDWLWLRSEGHRRATFRLEDGEWVGQWVAP